MTVTYQTFTEATLKDYPELKFWLDGSPDVWNIQELGDGNLNFVFLVQGPTKSLIVKQALPYLRVVGQSWPLTIDRAYFEGQAYSIQSQHAPRFVPKVFHTSREHALIVMEHLSPHIIMRKGILEGNYYPHFSESISSFLAHTLFYTSDLALKADKKKAMMRTFCDNVELCKISEDLIFTDPYYQAKTNRWTSPQLDAIASEFQNNEKMKIAISELKDRFLNAPQALIHGDLHTGSIMISDDDMRVIDPEFAFFGPMGFDVGMLLANLLMGYFSQEGHNNRPYAAWLLEQVEAVWRLFSEKFLFLWNHAERGDLYPSCFAMSPYLLENMQTRYMQRLFRDTVGFCAAEIIRRILGLAHTLELESIQDVAVRAACEEKALRFAADMLVHSDNYQEISTILKAAEALYASKRV